MLSKDESQHYLFSPRANLEGTKKGIRAFDEDPKIESARVENQVNESIITNGRARIRIDLR